MNLLLITRVKGSQVQILSARLGNGGVGVLCHDSIDTTVNTYGHLVEAGRKSAMELLSYEAGRTHQQSVH